MYQGDLILRQIADQLRSVIEITKRKGEEKKEEEAIFKDQSRTRRVHEAIVFVATKGPPVLAADPIGLHRSLRVISCVVHCIRSSTSGTYLFLLRAQSHDGLTVPLAQLAAFSGDC